MKRAPAILSALILHVTAMTADAQPRIQYTLSMPRPSSHLFEVTMSLDSLPAGGGDLLLNLPVWRPGRYLVLDFAGGVRTFDARSAAGEPLAWEKTDKSTWRVQRKGARGVTVRYDLFADEFDQRTRGLNDEHAFVNGAAVFMYAPEYRARSVELEVVPPAGWHVTTGMESAAANRFRAPDYDEFADCPLEIGKQRDFPFDVDGVPHVLSIYGGGNWEADTLVRDIAAIVRMNREFWGTLPYRRYVFLLHCAPRAGGGTEHLNSTIMGTGPFVFRDKDSYRGFLGLVSHEFFHTWNVKQLRPSALAPPDYQKENYTQELWVAEGTTSYYGSLLLVRAGLSTREKYLEGLANVVYDDRVRPGNRIEPLAASSFDAWIKYWRPSGDSYNSETDYYEKGAAVSLVLDLEIRHATENRRSLDDVMRTLFLKFPRSGRGYTNADVRREVANAGGEGLTAVFDSLVYGTAAIEWDRVLSYAGLEAAPKEHPPSVWAGLDFFDDAGRVRVTRVVEGSPAWLSGVNTGDEILALDGIRTTSQAFRDRLRDLRPGESLRLTFFRGDVLREITLTPEKPPVAPVILRQAEHPGALQKKTLDSWLPARAP